METATWNALHSVGIEILDEEHRILYELVHELARAVHYGHGPHGVRDIAERIIKADVHATEVTERAFVGTTSDILTEHRNEHIYLRARLRAFLDIFDPADPAQPLDLLLFVSSWLSDHMQNDRQRFGPPAKGPVQ